MSRLSISTWSLHRALGPMYRPAEDGSGCLVPHSDVPGTLTLLEVPAAIAERGIRTLEICHFHFPSVESAYVGELRAAIKDVGVELYSILIDTGDITHPDAAQRENDLRLIRKWIDVAAKCGAAHVRVIAGDAEASAESIALSGKGLRSLVDYAGERGVRVITENFKRLTRRAADVMAVLVQCDGRVGLCADFGNFGGPGKYDELATILPSATSVHAKARYAQPGVMDREDFLTCMGLAKASGFDGPYSLIFDGPGDEWESLEEIKREVVGFL